MTSVICKLRTAITNDDLPEVIKIVETNPDINLEATNFNTNTLLELAIYRKNSNISKYLISKGAKFTDCNQTLFFNALCWGDVDLIELMIQKNVDVSRVYDSKFPLFEARFRSNDIIKCIIDHCDRESLKKCTFNGNSMIDFMIDNENIEMVKLLLKKKVRITLKSKKLFNSVYGAAFNGNFEMVKLLIEPNIFFNEPLEHLKDFKNIYDPTTYSPIYVALIHNNFEIAEYLIDKGYGLNQSEDFGYNSCYNIATLAIRKNKLDLLDKILNTNPNSKLLNKQSPLFEAVKMNDHIQRESVIRKLVAKDYSPFDPIGPKNDDKPIMEYISALDDSSDDGNNGNKLLKALFNELFPPKYIEFKNMTCFDEIEHSDANITEFMKSPHNIIVKNNDNFKGYIRKDIVDFIQKKGTFYSQEKISTKDINHLKNVDIHFYDLINTGGKDCILVPYSDSVFITRYATKVSKV